jgi:hypothetical protein
MGNNQTSVKEMTHQKKESPKILEKSNQEFILSKNNYPSQINFVKQQTSITETTHSHKEFLKKLEESNPEFFISQINNPYKFFWKSNLDPDKKDDIPQWTPYEEEDNIYLEYFYQQKQEYAKIGDYIINFKILMQYHQKDTWRQRKIQRANPDEVDFIYRKSRFNTENFLNNFKETDIEKISLNQKTQRIGKIEISVKCSNIYSEINNKYTAIYFNVLPGNEIKILLLNSFLKELTINLKEMDIKSLRKNLNKELYLYADSINRYNIYKNKYLVNLDENNFCAYILKMYTEEGFLYRVVNKILREKDLKEFKRIQCYYICLLAAFEHSSSLANKKILTDPYTPYHIINNIKQNNKLFIYRGTLITEKEIKYFQTNPTCIRIYNEFLSCSMDKNTANCFAANCFIELELDFEINAVNNYFTFLNSDLTVFKGEREILLKSGVIIHINSFHRNIEKHGPQYIIKGKVISFNEQELFTCVFKGFNDEILYIEDNSIGSNPDNMKYLSEALKENKSITTLDLCNNSTASNPDNMKWLSEALKENKSITTLNLQWSSIKSNSDNMKHFSEALKKNKIITTLYLYNNSIGSNPDNMKYLSEGLKENKTITTLNLYNNSIGPNPDNMKYLSLALKENKTITTLDLGSNSIGSNPDNMKYLSDALKENKTIMTLNLGSNFIGLNPDNMKYLSEALKVNKSITSLDLGGNSIGSNPDNIKCLSEALKYRKTNTTLDLNDNKIGLNKDNMDYLSEALKENKNIKINL